MNSEHMKRQGNNSAAVLNVDNSGLQSYRQAREKLWEEKKQFEQMKSDVSDLKDMMAQILEKLNK